MTDVRKLMGRLNCSTAQFGAGRGGIPELTPQDIAGALGMLRDQSDRSLPDEEKPPLDPLAREVFCAVWWPDGARLNETALLALIGMKQHQEFGRQHLAKEKARLEHHLAGDSLSFKLNPTDYDRSLVESLRRKAAQADRDCWPFDYPTYSRIRRAVVTEIASPRNCKVCLGRGSATVGGLLVNCKQCDGLGTAPVSDRQRAAAIEVPESSYRDRWCRPYEWTYSLVRDAEQAAIDAMKRSLADAA